MILWSIQPDRIAETMAAAKLHAPWLVATAAGALGMGIVGRAAARVAVAALAAKYRAWAELRRNPPRPTYRDVWLRRLGAVRETGWQRLKRETEAAWREAGIPVAAETVFAVQAALAAAGATLALLWLRNPAVAALLGIAGAWMPSQVLRLGRESARRAVQVDLIRALHFFATEFHETRHVARSLLASARRVPGRVGNVFTRTAERLQSGEDHRTALAELADGLRGNPYGALFAQLCRIAFEDSSVAPMFSTLTVRLQEQAVLERRARSAFAGVKTIAHMLNAAAVPAAVAGMWITPGGREIYTGTVQGKVVVFVASVLILIGFWMNRNAGRIDDA